MPSGPHEEVERLWALAAARPGDPVVRARLALALGEAEGEASEAFIESTRRAVALARTCLELGISEPAFEAATLLYRGVGVGAGGRRGSAQPSIVTEVGLLMADATLQKSGDVEGTRKLLEAVVAEAPDAVGARLRAAALALGLGEPATARQWIEPVASASEQARSLYAQTLLALGLVDEAAAEARAGIEALPDASLLHQILGIAELTRGDIEAAIEALSEGLRLAPEDAVAYYNLALAFEASGSPHAALGVADAGLELSPADERLLALRARLVGPL